MPTNRAPRTRATKSKPKLPKPQPIVVFHGRAQLRVVANATLQTMPSAAQIKALAQWLQQNTNRQTQTVRVPAAQLSDFMKRLGKHFTIITAAGGVVRNRQGNILCIHRLGYWDLPKGKIDTGEEPPAAALREVMEETGLRALALLSLLPDTFHVYPLKRKWVLKQTFWFEMQARGKTALTPQTEEGISQAAWLPPTGLLQKAKPMYSSIRALLQAYLRKSRG